MGLGWSRGGLARSAAGTRAQLHLALSRPGLAAGGRGDKVSFSDGLARCPELSFCPRSQNRLQAPPQLPGMQPNVSRKRYDGTSCACKIHFTRTIVQILLVKRELAAAARWI